MNSRPPSSAGSAVSTGRTGEDEPESSAPPELQAVIQRTIERAYVGPLPPASELRAYDEALPGLAERIVGHFEREQAHRHKMDNRILDREYGLKSAGQWIGLFALVLMLSIIAYMVSEGFAIQATTLGVGTLAAVVGIFVLGRRSANSSEPSSD